MSVYKFTQIEKQYFDLEIEADSYAEALEKFNNTMDKAINWDNPDYIDSEFYYEVLQTVGDTQ